MCFITYTNFMTTILASSGNTTIAIIPTPISEMMTFCDNFCFETSKTYYILLVYLLRGTE